MEYDLFIEGTPVGREDVRMLLKELHVERNRLLLQLAEGQSLESAILQDIFEPRDWADTNSAQREAVRFSAVCDLAARRLNAIQHALDRAAKGQFSICERCDVGIPVERLRVLPETTLCTDCAREVESERRRLS